MHLFLLRHGLADWPDWNGSDDDRPLTETGREELREVAKFVARLKRPPTLILTSPLPRANQTARIVAEKVRAELREEPELRPGFSLANLSSILTRSSVEALMLVGHEPDFSGAVRALTGGRIKMSKGAIACVEIDSRQANGILLWLVSPKLIRAVR